MKLCGIYKITFGSKNFYIGSSVDIRKRFSSHKSGLKKGNHHAYILQRAYRKYGLERINLIIIEFCERDQLHAREQFWLDTLKPEYNSTLDAYSSSRDPAVARKISKALRGRTISAEWARKSGEARRGRKNTPEHIQAIKLALTGTRRPDCVRAKIAASKTGSTLSPEHRAAISEARKGKPLTEKQLEATRRTAEMRRGIPLSDEVKSRRPPPMNRLRVRCIDTGEEFDSLLQASKSRGKTNANLSTHLAGKSKTFDKHRWELI